jgi:hypothetical protein
LVKIAYEQAFNIKNITSAFRTCGIVPFNSNIFSDDNFASSCVTDRPLPDITLAVTKPPHPVESDIEAACSNEKETLPTVATGVETVLKFFKKGEFTMYDQSKIHLFLFFRNC